MMEGAQLEEKAEVECLSQGVTYSHFCGHFGHHIPTRILIRRHQSYRDDSSDSSTSREDPNHMHYSGYNYDD